MFRSAVARPARRSSRIPGIGPNAASRTIAARAQAEGERGEVQEHTLDFRVGGREHTRTRIGGGPFQGTPLTNDSIYRDIVPNQRIVFAYTMTLGDKRISSSQATVEFLPSGNGTILAFTEQGAFFEGADGPERREQGWKSLLGQLQKFLAP